MLTAVTNPYRDEIAGYLRRAHCHYGATLLYDEAGFTVEEAARELGISRTQVSGCRRGVRRVLDGEFADGPTQASYDEAIIRALKHFRGEMTPGLRQYLDTRHAALRTKFNLTTGVEPLRCKYGFDGAGKSTAPPHVEPAPVSDYDELPELETDVAPDLETAAAVDDAEADWLSYASAEEIREVDDLAMELAMEEAARRWPDATVQRMPHNNPGYDIEVIEPAAGTRYIEVKGTRSPDPCFFITSGEVEHSETHPDRYSIWIFAAMDLATGTATLHEHDGPVSAPHFELRPVQYRGRFTGPS